MNGDSIELFLTKTCTVEDNLTHDHIESKRLIL